MTTHDPQPTGHRFLTWLERAERVQHWLDLQAKDIDAILDDPLVTSGIKQSCRRLATAAGAIGVTVDLLAMACRDLGPGGREPDVRASADAERMERDKKVRVGLRAITRQAQILNEYPGETTTEKSWRHNLIIKLAKAALDLLEVPAELRQERDEEEQQDAPPSLGLNLDVIEKWATLIRAKSDDKCLTGCDCASWTTHIVHRVGVIRKAFGITE